jgi:uncharacterized repeat protein (TIGR04138 family)
MDSNMSRNDMIATDLPCRACAYNLRGLSFKSVCPECAEPIQNSLVSATSYLAKLLGEDPQNMARRLKHLGVANDIGCSVDALMFVIDAIQQAHSREPTVVLDAVHICRAVQTRAKTYFNDETEARDLLDEWGIRGSEDIGKIVVGLIQHGLLQTLHADTLDQFNGLFSLENLFPAKT